MLARAAQFVMQLVERRVVRGGTRRPRLARGRRRRFLEDNQVEAGAHLRERPDHDVGGPGACPRAPGQRAPLRRLLGARGLLQGVAQVRAQALAHQGEGVERGPRRGRQIRAGGPEEIGDVAVLADDHAGRGVLVEEDALEGAVQRRLQDGRRARRRRGCPLGTAGLPGQGQFHGGADGHLAAAVDPARPVHRLEQVRPAGDVLGGAEEEEAPGAQRVVEQAHHLALDLAVQVDEQVAARDQVQLWEGRVLDEVVRGEDAHLAHLFAHAVLALLPREEAFQAFLRHVLADALRIAALPGDIHGVAVYVRGEDLHSGGSR